MVCGGRATPRAIRGESVDTGTAAVAGRSTTQTALSSVFSR
jgi:hypothetical protein